MDYCIKIGLELHSVSREVYNVYDCQKSFIDQYKLQVEKLEQQKKALRELVGDITRCIEYCTEEANMSYLHYWREKLKEIGGE